MLSLDAAVTRSPARSSCSQFAPRANGDAFLSNAANIARQAQDIAACVPYNPFGGPDNSAAADYFTYNATHHAWMSQPTSTFAAIQPAVRTASWTGQLRRAASIARKRTATEDPFVHSGFTNAVVIPTFSPIRSRRKSSPKSRSRSSRTCSC
jgi:hypothetical protein